jgi:hypothetical protein
MSELPPFLKRERVTTGAEGRFMCDEMVSPNELRFGKLSHEDLVLKVTDRIARYLDVAGAIRPYAYSCRLENGVGYIFHAEEL